MTRGLTVTTPKTKSIRKRILKQDGGLQRCQLALGPKNQVDPQEDTETGIVSFHLSLDARPKNQVDPQEDTETSPS